MRSDVKSEQPRRGRPPKSKVDEQVDGYRTRAWFYSVANAAQEFSPTELERIFQRQSIEGDPDGQALTRMWDKYRSGAHLPSDKINAKGKKGIALIVASEYPETLWLLQHPLWDAMSCKRASHEILAGMIEKFDRSVQRYYQDLCTTRSTDPMDNLLQLAGQSIWIERRDYYSALDHLAANLMMLRLDFIKFNQCAYGGIAENIAKTLGPLSISPWFENFYEEFFDYLQENIWCDIFDHMYHPDLVDGQGWRKTQDDWLV